jgi:hypothetical protein
MLLSTSPPQATCTASVRLRIQDSKAQGSTVRTCLCQVVRLHPTALGMMPLCIVCTVHCASKWSDIKSNI